MCIRDRVYIVVIVTILRCCQTIGLHLLISYEISLQSFIQLLQCVFLIVEYQFLDGCHSVSVCSQPGPYYARTEVVHSSAGRYVLTVFHTSFVHDGHQRLRCQISVNSLRNNSCHRRPLGHVLDLLLHSRIELFEGRVLIQVSQVRSYLLTVPERYSVVENQLYTDRPLSIGCCLLYTSGPPPITA